METTTIPMCIDYFLLSVLDLGVELFFFQLAAGLDVEGDGAEVADACLDEQGEALGAVDVEVGGQTGDLDDALELFRVEIIREMGVLEPIGVGVLS